MKPSPPVPAAADLFMPGRNARRRAARVAFLCLSVALGAALLASCSSSGGGTRGKPSKPIAPVQRAGQPAAKADTDKAPATVPHVDLPRYMGEWHVIAHVPYFLEKGKVDTSDIYRMRSDGEIENIYQFRKGSLSAPYQQWKARAWVVNHDTNAEWKLQFIRPITTTYLVVDLDPSYQWSVVTIPSRKLVWVLSKNRELPAATYAGILQRLSVRGFDVTKLVKVPR